MLEMMKFTIIKLYGPKNKPFPVGSQLFCYTRALYRIKIERQYFNNVFSLWQLQVEF